MNGAINIAVAEFIDAEPDGAPPQGRTADDLARAAANALQQTLATDDRNLGVEVLPPDKTGRIEGRTADLRATAAKALARRINADVVLYGSVSTAVDATTFTPEFYMSDRQLQGAEDLSGDYEFGVDIVSDGDIRQNPATFTDLRDRVLARTKVLAEFIHGVAQYSRRDLSGAAKELTAADVDAWDGQDGKELLYLFLGNTAGRHGDLATAKQFYDRALLTKPGYARALLGEAEVDFQMSGATRDCSPDQVDAEQLAAVDADLNGVLNAPLPSVSFIPEKATYMRARIDLCMSQAGLADRFDAARQELLTVVNAYEAGETALQDFAAESHAALGLIAFPDVTDTEDGQREQAYRAAIAEFTQAKELSQHRDREAEFLTMLGYLHFKLGEFEQANAAYNQGIRADPANRTRYEDVRRQWETGGRSRGP